MKKNNKIVYALALIASVVLLALWFFLGFDKVHMLDLFIAVVWWIVIVASILLIKHFSKDEKEEKQDQQTQSTMRI